MCFSIFQDLTAYNCPQRPHFYMANHQLIHSQALKQELRDRALEGGAILSSSTVNVDSVTHTATGSSFKCADGSQVKTKMLLDCSGFESKLVQLDGRHDPGVQVAYGIECECDVCPYDENAMTLMDYRTDYFASAQDEVWLSEYRLLRK